jgi:hypothetical protein
VLRRWKKETERIARTEMEGSPRHPKPAASVLELVSIVELRAEGIERAMRKRKHQLSIELGLLTRFGNCMYGM